MAKFLEKFKTRKVAYIGIVGGLVVLTLAIFSVAQYNKAKLKSSDSQVLASRNILDTIGWEAIEDETSIYHDKALYYYDIYTHFSAISKTNSTTYIVTSVIAYTLSIGSLVSFGLVLKDADKQKEKEDNAQ